MPPRALTQRHVLELTLATDPRVMVLPVVNWEGQNGRSQVQVDAFATVWLDSYSGGKVTVHFISGSSRTATVMRALQTTAGMDTRCSSTKGSHTESGKNG